MRRCLDWVVLGMVPGGVRVLIKIARGDETNTQYSTKSQRSVISRRPVRQPNR